MSFKDDFIKALNDGQTSLYNAFVDFSRRNLPVDADARYQYLRSSEGRFIARDEEDVNVYTVRVAGRHHEKFRWLYDALFSSYSQVFSKDVDLVVWGCGCGLDLLALYDRASAQRNPQLWLKVRHITLVDISPAALARAKIIAETLFPLAEVADVVCDLANLDEIRRKICLRRLTAYLPRVHLISNLLDLFQDVVPLAKAIKRQSARTINNLAYYNELVVAFSPEYRGGRVAANLSAFRNEWGTTVYSEEVKTVGNAPMNCEFCAFAYRTLVNDACYRSYMRGRNQALNRMVSQCPIAQPGFDFHKMVVALSGVTVCGRNFFRAYRWAEAVQFRNVVERIVFVADPDIMPRVVPCVLEIGSATEAVEERMKKAPARALKALIRRRGDDGDAVGGQASDIKAIYWNGTDLILGSFENQDECLNGGGVDYSLYFRVDPGDAEPLPSLDCSMDSTQKEVIYSRAQYRKIRGSAGCGKSTTMMWHAVMSVLRTHLPALLVCKTVTLFNRHVRRMAATLLREVPGLEYVDSDLFMFKTLDKVLCEHRQDKFHGCILNRCVRCVGCEHAPVADCGEWNSVGNQWRRLGEVEKSRCCDVCVEENLRELSRKGTRYAVGATSYGCVMIDEVQSVDPSLVQAVVNLTFAGNVSRECYVFCDERQCLNPESVEIDPEKGKLRVKVPDRGHGYGHWVDLNTPYRVSSDFTGQLSDVSAKLQSLTIAKYGAVELAKIAGGGQRLLSSGDVFHVRRSSEPLIEALQSEIQTMRVQGRDTITIICDNGINVRELLTLPEAKDWVSTHMTHRSHDEQGLRMTFGERRGCVHITTVALAQGWDFSNVIFVTDSEQSDNRWNVLENVLTGATRATASMLILDRSRSGWLYESLRECQQV